jgi:dipeptidyl aminopeptidase/acylaminoacyl peptidase
VPQVTLEFNKKRNSLFALLSLAVFVGGAPGNAYAADLLTARHGFLTKTIAQLPRDGKAAKPPVGLLEVTHYTSAVGPLVAYITPSAKAKQKQPAVLWIKGGWGGIGDFLWDKKTGQSVMPFVESGFVVMATSLRGENDNPGKVEAFLGEVDDVLAALDYLAAQPGVDPTRIYVAGHSTGGTMALLVAQASGKPRAVFSFGGHIDTQGYFENKGRDKALPFDWRDGREGELRTPGNFTASIKTPL